MEASDSLLLFLADAGRRARYSEVLGRAGFRVLQAPTAAMALTRCSREQPSVILTEVVVPGMHGIDIARALRACAPRSREPFIIGLVERCFDSATDSAEALLFDRLMSEPVSLDSLGREIRDARRRRTHRRWTPVDQRLHLA